MNYNQKNLEAARKRRQVILDLLHERGTMTRVELRDALSYVSDDTLGNTLSRMTKKGEIEYLPGKQSHRHIRPLVRETFSHDPSSNIAKARENNPACRKGYKPKRIIETTEPTKENIPGLRVVNQLDKPASQTGTGGQCAGRSYSTLQCNFNERSLRV